MRRPTGDRPKHALGMFCISGSSRRLVALAPVSDPLFPALVIRLLVDVFLRQALRRGRPYNISFAAKSYLTEHLLCERAVFVRVADEGVDEIFQDPVHDCNLVLSISKHIHLPIKLKVYLCCGTRRESPSSNWRYVLRSMWHILLEGQALVPIIPLCENSVKSFVGDGSFIAATPAGINVVVLQLSIRPPTSLLADCHSHSLLQLKGNIDIFEGGPEFIIHKVQLGEELSLKNTCVDGAVELKHPSPAEADKLFHVFIAVEVHFLGKEWSSSNYRN